VLVPPPHTGDTKGKGRATGGLSEAVAVSKGGGGRTVKIVDFGETKNLSLASPLTLEVGTYKWMPPEIMGVGDYGENPRVGVGLAARGSCVSHAKFIRGGGRDPGTLKGEPPTRGNLQT
jgi:serine/threonine protein kinase